MKPRCTLAFNFNESRGVCGASGDVQGAADAQRRLLIL
jgi:hypothetical protein